MAATWPEVETAKKENRRELTLNGPDINKRIDESGFDNGVYDLVSLNFLDISGTSLSELKSDIGRLVNVTSLILCNNQLVSIPAEIGSLTKLKILNISNNRLKDLPESICSFPEIHTLNVSMNSLTSFPCVSALSSIHIFNISHNQLQTLPDGIYDRSLEHLSELHASSNQIAELSADISNLSRLSLLNLANNKLVDVPPELSMCTKLKELDVKGNKFKDRRFGKLVEQCQTKSLLDYLNNILKKEDQKSGKGKEKKKRNKDKTAAEDDGDVEELKNMIEVLYFPSEKGLTITVTPAVLSVRPYIVCCIVRNINLQATNTFKNFITLQTKLHDTVCQKRQAATIATHDLNSITKPLTYDAMFPHVLQIVPLSRQKEITGEKLVETLRKEAEEQRKEKKRNTISGVHKYLELLADKVQYPCLINGNGQVISFPPITNSEKTKISKETTAILIEVTSSTSLDTCKKVMDELLYKMLEIGLGEPRGSEKRSDGGVAGASGDSEDTVVFQQPSAQKLLVEQVKILDKEGSMKVVYPSRTDLISGVIEVQRPFD
ncbi:hypothetical protein CHS0354_025419 [Potamilus streckersoni]|uniref:B3/B4 tRNA-binding domain-containing protein n=1 Tax=Potamilus streckersoni TaxID=2493646 RepID=A0AAE0SPR7_9BIVA|nr:hypothetical protein CHS0354_025419 [Potamilus streckersoni]